jgi:site-specific DNA-methyltransferase (adenine-specific)
MVNNVQLFKGDCLEVMKGIDDKSIDMILCDLPYGTTKCKWDVIIPFESLWEQYNRIIKDRGIVVLFGSEPFTSALRMSNVKNYRYDLKWEKDQGSDFLNAKLKPLKNYEDIAIFYKKRPKYNPQMREGFKEWTKKDTGKTIIEHLGRTVEPREKHSVGNKRYPLSILKFNRVRNGLHPCQKPVDLLEWLIKSYTDENDLALDNCMGVGSVGEACINTNRKFIGIELDDNYFEIAKKRIEEHGNG